MISCSLGVQLASFLRFYAHRTSYGICCIHIILPSNLHPDPEDFLPLMMRCQIAAIQTGCDLCTNL